MKKSIVIAFVAAASMAFAAPHFKIPTNEVEVIVATSNYVNAIKAWVSNTNGIPAHRKGLLIPPFVLTNKTAMAEIDSALEQKPPIAVLYSMNNESALPKAFVAAKSYYANTKPHLVQFMSGKIARESMTKAEVAAACIEALAIYTAKHLDMKRAKIGKYLAKLIVPALRRQGKAITTGPDGVSPVKVFSDRISTALNSPRFEGLNGILTELGVPTQLDIEACGVPSEEEALELKRKIMLGDKELTPDDTGKLSSALGVDGYNAFLQDYNGGTR